MNQLRQINGSGWLQFSNTLQEYSDRNTRHALLLSVIMLHVHILFGKPDFSVLIHISVITDDI
jgi:hypothetical protein